MVPSREDGTIFDTRTNLLWQQVPSDKEYTWKEAHTYCEELSLAGHKDWRLPTVEELKTLIEKEHKLTICPIFKCKPDWYWSSTTVAVIPNGAWYVGFFGFVGFNGDKDSRRFVRAVRG